MITSTVTIEAGHVTQQNFALPPAPRILIVNSGAWYYEEYPQYFSQPLDDLGYVYDERRIKQRPADVPTADDLRPYNLVIWSAPQDSPGLIGASSAITRYLSGGGNIILTGQDVAFWDSGASGQLYASYLRNYLKTGFVQDNAPDAARRGRSRLQNAGPGLRYCR